MTAPASPPAPIRLLLVDDHPVMRAGMANVLAMDSGFEVVAQADDGESALVLWRQHRPDVTLLDISMGGIDGIDTMRRLRQDHPAARVLILTSSDANEDVRLALKAGACGYVTKNIRASELGDSIRTIHAGGRILSEELKRKLTEDDGSRHLTPREMEVLGLVRQGFTNDEIGRLLGISERTARAHMGTILEKLNASDRAAAVARGFETGILKA
ncbi:MAG: response regulator transcription factor [Luteolibacter sp.]